MILHSRVGADGVLRNSVPIGNEDADSEVAVIIAGTGWFASAHVTRMA